MMAPMTEKPLLVVLGGLPGSGKTTVARALDVPDAAEAGYAAGARVALDNLRLGLPVVDLVAEVLRRIA